MMATGKIRFDSLADTLGFQLRRASAALKSALEAELEPLGLRTSEATLLICVGENPGRTQGDIGRELRVKPANMVPIVGRLASAGLLERAPAPRRAIALRLTPKGTLQLEEVRKALQRQEDRITGLLSGADKIVVVQALKAIANKACCDDRG